MSDWIEIVCDILLTLMMALVYYVGFRKVLEDDAVAARKMVKGTEDDNDDDDVEDDPLYWAPKKIVTQWQDDDNIRCISIIVQLSGGSTLTDSNDVDIAVSNNGEELAISEVWCPLMTDVRNFYTTFPKHHNETEENACRKRIAMANTCDTMSRGKGIRSTYRMKLPFHVDPSVKRIRFLGTEDGKRYATVDLAERSMDEVESFSLFTTKMNVSTNSDKKRKTKNLF
jgi:hypothetical protein